MKISKGTVHKIPKDLQKVLVSSSLARKKWEDISPIARNEWICWIESTQKPETRNEHIKRTVSELKEGKNRPCCWYGCIHRKDKKISKSVQKLVLDRKSKSK